LRGASSNFSHSLISADLLSWQQQIDFLIIMCRSLIELLHAHVLLVRRLYQLPSNSIFLISPHESLIIEITLFFHFPFSVILRPSRYQRQSLLMSMKRYKKIQGERNGKKGKNLRRRLSICFHFIIASVTQSLSVKPLICAFVVATIQLPVNSIKLNGAALGAWHVWQYC